VTSSSRINEEAERTSQRRVGRQAGRDLTIVGYLPTPRVSKIFAAVRLFLARYATGSRNGTISISWLLDNGRSVADDAAVTRRKHELDAISAEAGILRGTLKPGYAILQPDLEIVLLQVADEHVGDREEDGESHQAEQR
jgi:hypothetical protein